MTEPGVLWLAVEMRHCAEVKGPRWLTVNDQQDILEAAALIKRDPTLGSKFTQYNLSRLYVKTQSEHNILKRPAFDLSSTPTGFDSKIYLSLYFQ